jgi:hypothetical protein
LLDTNICLPTLRFLVFFTNKFNVYLLKRIWIILPVVYLFWWNNTVRYCKHRHTPI